MCLIVDRQKTKRFSGTADKAYMFYKTFDVYDNGNIRSPVTAMKIEKDFLEFVKAKGCLNIAKNSLKIYLPAGSILIDRGSIHAHTKHKKAPCGQITIPIIVDSQDVIAFGINEDVCFFKYKIPKSSWKRIRAFSKTI